MLERLGLHRRELRAWAYYDVANSAFMTTVLMVFPVYFVRVPASGLAAEVARSRFALATSLAVVLVGLLGPLLGALADYRGSKKAFLGAFLALGASATAALALATGGHWAFALAMFVVANVGVTATLAFYNALLPGIASESEIDRVSTAGFALGYLGGGTLFACNLWMIADPARFGLPDAGAATRVAFLSVAVWWVLFSIPLFRHVKEPAARAEAGERAGRERAAASRPAASRRASASCAGTGTPACCCWRSSSTTTPSTRSSAWRPRSGTRSASRRRR